MVQPPMVRDQGVVVVGGGSSACEEALYLPRYAKRIVVLVRKDQMRARPVLIERLAAPSSIKVRYNTGAIEAKGDEDLLRAVRVGNNESSQAEDIFTSGLFYAIGHATATYLVRNQVDCDEDGCIFDGTGDHQDFCQGLLCCG